MKVSVITVCYNAEKCIEKTINSVLSQTYRDIEYLIIDGQSIDQTVPTIKGYLDQIAYFLSEPDSGVYDAMNKGIKAATGDVIFFLNADDVFYDDFVVENVAKEFSQSQDNIIYGDVLVADDRGGLRATLKKHIGVDKMYFLYDTICHQTVFSRSSVFKTYGLFDTRYKIAGDYEWLLRTLVLHKVSCKYINMTITIFPEGGISSNEEFRTFHIEERHKIINKYFRNFEVKLYSSRLMSKAIKINVLKSIIWRLLKWNLYFNTNAERL